MHNIIKALNRQTLRDKFLIAAVIICIFTAAFPFIMYLGSQLDFSDYTGSLYVTLMSSSYPVMLPIAILILSTRITGWDYADKTMNYEILSGHSRSEVYWSRILVSICWCMGLSIIFIFLPIILLTIINGWGYSMEVGGAIKSCLLILLPILRTTCEFMLFTFLTGNCYLGLLIGFGYIEISSIIGMTLEQYHIIDKCTWQIATTNIAALLTFNGKFGYVDGEDVEVYEAMLEPSLVSGTVIASLMISAGCILLGYLIFRKRDIS